MTRRRAARTACACCALLPALLLAACDTGGAAGGPGAVSEGEAKALDEAAEMLEERRLPDGVLPSTGAQIDADAADATGESQIEETPAQ